MTHDPAGRHDAADLPPVDQVIHDARETSWRDPATPASAAPPASWSSHAPGAASHGAVAAPSASQAHHAPVGAHDTHDAHTPDHGEALGPIDTAQWGAGIIGVAVALVVTACFVLATQGLGAY